MRHLLLLSLLLMPGRLAFGQAVSPIPADAQAAMGELRKEPFRAHVGWHAKSSASLLRMVPSAASLFARRKSTPSFPGLAA